MHVLILEDDKSINSLFADALVTDGQTCDQAYTPREAFALFGRRKPDCILLDWMLPTFGGADVLYVLGPHLQNVRVVICTASMADIPAIIHDVPIAAVLAKPFDVDLIPVALGYQAEP